MPRKKKIPIHPTVKERLGYDVDQPDEEVLEHWKKRSTHVCKPCWELKYCPYGPFVEQSPLLPPLRSSVESQLEYFKDCLEKDVIGQRVPLTEQRRAYYQELLDSWEEDPQILAQLVVYELSVEARFENATCIEDVLGNGDLGRIQNYQVPFSFDEETHEIEIDAFMERKIAEKMGRIQKQLEEGYEDNRKPLDRIRREDFQKRVDSYNPDDYPEEIAEAFTDLQCSTFGHICPVVFVGETVTESSDMRRRGRYISFKTKMRVVRRDNHTCQECGEHLRDDEVEFDHIIPVAKGGSSEEHNIRLTCFDCNRGKSDTVKI
ncbi:HNH endonuclease [Methylophaga sp. OBS1]|uniref:HNH endonuclease n=1 Tax=Methylophaga sp. OBS1 TaxID=2991933 RepID=UPI00225018E4|nr:HNH endonuclease signature motif containing protein [Methylophaga sp. OBS1]MCX4194040.1 HNH endonuclease [Methylophaga sp. OBS1]